MAKSKGKKIKYKEGTINGVRVGSRGLAKKKKQDEEFNSLVKMLCSAVCILIMVFVVNAIIRSNFTFNGIMYEEPETNEVVEIVTGTNESEPAERVNLNLKGNLVINLKVGQKFSDPGYEATSDLKGDISSYVEVSGDVDTSKVGTYKVIYTLNYRGISPKLTRLVKVTGNNSSSSDSSGGSSSDGGNSSKPSATPTPSPTPTPTPSVTPTPSSTPKPTPTPTPSAPPVQNNITLKLNGDATVYIVEGSSYSDSGATATDSNGNNVSNKIVVSGNVNTNVAGTYTITYSIDNYNGQKLTVVRNVVVQKMRITLSVDNKNYTNKSVNITITADVDQFSNIVLPSGERVTNSIYTYKVTKNGTYEFVVYNTTGAYRKASMVISNIDKEKPKGTCKITHNATGSIITITAKDNVGIASYTYSGNTYTTNVITFDNHLKEGLQMNVGFYDKAGNFGNANCLSPAITE